MKFKIIFLFSVFFIILIPLVQSITVSPTGLSLDYNPGQTVRFSFNVYDSSPYGIKVLFEGDFVENINYTTDLSKCNGACKIDFVLKIPNMDNSPGKKTTIIKFRDLPPPPEYGRSAITATAQILIPISFISPYPNKYITTSVITADGRPRYQLGDKIYFKTSITSHGKETINSITGKLLITAEDGQFVTEVPLTSLSNFKYKDSGNMYAEWQTNKELRKGRYYYKAIVDYDGNSAEHSRSLEIGDRLVEAQGIEPNVLETDTINKVNVNLKNFWLRELSAYVVAVLKDKSGNKLSTTQSSTIQVYGMEFGSVYLYLDTKNILPGEYKLELTTHFAEGLTTYKELNIPVIEKKEVIQENIPSPNDTGNYLIIITILIAIAGIIFFFIRKNESKKEEF